MTVILRLVNDSALETRCEPFYCRKNSWEHVDRMENSFGTVIYLKFITFVVFNFNSRPLIKFKQKRIHNEYDRTNNSNSIQHNHSKLYLYRIHAGCKILMKLTVNIKIFIFPSVLSLLNKQSQADKWSSQMY